MKKYLTGIVVGIFIAITGALPLVVPVSTAGAVNLYPACSGSSSTVCKSVKDDDASKLIKSVINILLYVLAAIAVIMIIVGGIRYTLSNGNATEITGAKNTILYSVVGLVVAMLAWSIVNFVIGRF
jgi:hypothetical protein